MSRTAKLTRVPVGADPTNYKPGFRARQKARAASLLAQTPEQAEQQRQTREDFMRAQAAAWGVLPEDVDLWISDSAAYRAMTEARKSK